MKTLNEYLALPYRMELVKDPDEGGFVVSFPDLPGCITCGETEEEAVKRRQQMYGCNGKCCDRVIDPETGEGQYFICGGIDTCDETRVGEFIGMVGAVLFIVLAPIMFIAGIVALIVFGI